MTTASHSLWMIEPLCLCTYTFISLHPQTRRPTSGSFNTISAYSDACWGSQLGSLVAGGTLLSLFKFRSMNGGIIFKNGGPIGWLGDRQDRTSLSSCKAKIGATCATSKRSSTSATFLGVSLMPVTLFRIRSPNIIGRSHCGYLIVLTYTYDHCHSQK